MFTCEIANYRNPKHAADLVVLLDNYARDPMGGGKPLAQYARDNVVTELSRLPHAFSVIVYEGESAVALANCFEGFSTFKAKPLMNIHDVMVHSDYRGRGLSKLLLEKVEEIAKARGCCKITLEVLEGNGTAQKAYQSFGFAGYELDPTTGKAMFWQKNL